MRGAPRRSTPTQRRGGYHASPIRAPIGGHRRDGGDTHARGGKHVGRLFLPNVDARGYLRLELDRRQPNLRVSNRLFAAPSSAHPPDARREELSTNLEREGFVCAQHRNANAPCGVSNLRSHSLEATTHDRASNHNLVTCGARSEGRRGDRARFPTRRMDNRGRQPTQKSAGKAGGIGTTSYAVHRATFAIFCYILHIQNVPPKTLSFRGGVPHDDMYEAFHIAISAQKRRHGRCIRSLGSTSVRGSNGCVCAPQSGTPGGCQIDTFKKIAEVDLRTA